MARRRSFRRRKGILRSGKRAVHEIEIIAVAVIAVAHEFVFAGYGHVRRQRERESFSSRLEAANGKKPPFLRTDRATPAHFVYFLAILLTTLICPANEKRPDEALKFLSVVVRRRNWRNRPSDKVITIRRKIGRRRGIKATWAQLSGFAAL